MEVRSLKWKSLCARREIYEGIRQQVGSGSREAAGGDQLSRERTEVARCSRGPDGRWREPRVSVADAGEAIPGGRPRQWHAAAGRGRPRWKILPRLHQP